MRLEIQNINKIKEADIALNGLTVIVGENDMGKSTIGRAFFSIIKAVSNMRSLSNESSANKASKHIDSLYKHFYGKKIIDGTMDLLPRVKSEMERTGIKLLWGTANCFNNPRYMCGAGTAPSADVFAYAAAQIKKELEITVELGSQCYVFWGSR